MNKGLGFPGNVQRVVTTVNPNQNEIEEEEEEDIDDDDNDTFHQNNNNEDDLDDSSDDELMGSGESGDEEKAAFRRKKRKKNVKVDDGNNVKSRVLGGIGVLKMMTLKGFSKVSGAAEDQQLQGHNNINNNVNINMNEEWDLGDETIKRQSSSSSSNVPTLPLSMGAAVISQQQGSKKRVQPMKIKKFQSTKTGQITSFDNETVVIAVPVAISAISTSTSTAPASGSSTNPFASDGYDPTVTPPSPVSQPLHPLSTTQPLGQYYPSISLHELMKLTTDPVPEPSNVELDSEHHHGHHQNDLQPLPWWKMVLLNLYWFAFSLLWFTLLIVVVPSQIKELKGDESKGHGMFVLFTIGGVVTFSSSVIMGYANDRMPNTKMGRRRPWMLAGGLAMLPFIFGIALTKHFPLYVFLYICLTFTSVVSTVPYNGLFADVVPSSQHGSASAVMGALSQTGNLVGATMGLFYVALGIYSFVFLSIILVTGLLITVFSIDETERAKPQQKSRRAKKAGMIFTWKTFLNPKRLYRLVAYPLVEPMIRSRDFRWVFFTRFVFQLGQFTVQEYLQYWLSNCILLPAGIGAETAVSICALPMLITAIFSALMGGIISDKLGGRRKILVYFSGGIMVICCIAFMFVSNFFLATVISGCFGLGYGCFLSVDFAIVMDVLPSKQDYARDMAVWNCALILPQVLATPFAGLMLDEFQAIGNDYGVKCLGYVIIFGMAAVYFFLGTAFVSRIQGIK